MASLQRGSYDSAFTLLSFHYTSILIPSTPTTYMAHKRQQFDLQRQQGWGSWVLRLQFWNLSYNSSFPCDSEFNFSLRIYQFWKKKWWQEQQHTFLSSCLPLQSWRETKNTQEFASSLWETNRWRSTLCGFTPEFPNDKWSYSCTTTAEFAVWV